MTVVKQLSAGANSWIATNDLSRFARLFIVVVNNKATNGIKTVVSAVCHVALNVLLHHTMWSVCNPEIRFELVIVAKNLQKRNNLWRISIEDGPNLSHLPLDGPGIEVYNKNSKSETGLKVYSPNTSEVEGDG